MKLPLDSEVFDWVKARNFPPDLQYGSIKPHTLEKLIRLAKYLKVYMKKVRKYSRQYYIDLFAGVGLHQIEHTTDFVWGSAAIAMKIPIKFSNYKLCDVDPNCIKNLERIAGLYNVQPEYYGEDCNQIIGTILKDVPSGAPCFCFVDPYGLQIHWQTLEFLSNWKKMELLITLQIPGALRVLEPYPMTFDAWFGPGAANVRTEAKDNNLSGPKLRKFLCDKYIQKLKSLGFPFVVGALKVGKPSYYLIFAGNHKMGEKIMNGVFYKDIWIQKTLRYRSS